MFRGVWEGSVLEGQGGSSLGGGNGPNVRGDRSTQRFCNLNLGLEIEKAVHSFCKDFALIIC